MIDFYLGVLNYKEYIINKRFLSSIKKLEEVRRIVSGLERGVDEECL